MTVQVKIQEFGKHRQVMVSIPRAIAQLLGYTKGKTAEWTFDKGELKLKLED